MNHNQGMDPPVVSDPAALQAVYETEVSAEAKRLMSEHSREEQQILALRKTRVDTTRAGGDPSKVGPEDCDPQDAAESIFLYKPRMEGRHAVARIFTPIVRSDETAATKYAGHSSVNGAIPRTKPGLRGGLARKQLAARMAEETFARIADACKRFEALVASFSPGGRVWLACRSGSAKRALRQCVYEARKVARTGAYERAIEILLNRE